MEIKIENKTAAFCGKLWQAAGRSGQRGGKEVPAIGAITCMQQLLLQGVISQ